MGSFVLGDQRKAVALSQALSSGSNFLISLIAVRVLHLGDFGAFSASLALVYLGLALTRSLVCEPLMALSSRPGVTAGNAVRATLCVSVATAVVLAAIGWSFPTHLGPLRILGLGYPLVALQDVLRHAAFADLRGDLAVLSDTVWAGAQSTAMIALAAAGRLDSVGSVVGCWLLGAAAGAVVGRRVCGVHFSAGSARQFFGCTRELSAWSLPQFAVGTAVSQSLPGLLTAVVGPAGVGLLRAAQLVTMPVGSALSALNAYLVPRFATEEHLLARASNAGLRAFAVSGAFAATLLVGGETLMSAVLDLHDVPLPILAAVAATLVVQATALPFGAAMRARGRGRDIFLGQLASTVIGLPLTLYLSRTYGATGAAGGILAQTILLAVVSSSLLWRSELRREASMITC